MQAALLSLSSSKRINTTSSICPDPFFTHHLLVATTPFSKPQHETVNCNSNSSLSSNSLAFLPEPLYSISPAFLHQVFCCAKNQPRVPLGAHSAFIGIRQSPDPFPAGSDHSLYQVQTAFSTVLCSRTLLAFWSLTLTLAGYTGKWGRRWKHEEKLGSKEKQQGLIQHALGA